ncbi:hypothetical protein Tco_0887581 [Tanacetum coccineum]
MARTNQSYQSSLLAHSQAIGHVIYDGSTKRGGICTVFSQKRSTMSLNMDCHVGNPCKLTSDPTDIIKPPMIGEMKGGDWTSF